MKTIKYITEKNIRNLIETEVKSHKDKGFIIDPEGFSKHCIDTGRISNDIAKNILKKHPTLKKIINPDIIRVESYMHDFSKINEGNKYHEVGTSYLILTQGDTNLGLITGGSKSDRKKILTEMASLVPPDYALYETLGKDNFPDDALYKDVIERFIERINLLRKELSGTDEPLSMEEFALPFTLNQQIASYADLTNVNGKIVPIQERLSEIEQRYGNPAGACYDPTYVRVTREIRPRMLVLAKTIEELMK